MSYAVPNFTRKQITRAGAELLHPSDARAHTEALKLVNHWRACHAYPINTFQSTLRARLKRLDLERALVATRLKRIPSIVKKLQNNEGMALARMQDVGGLRAIVTNMKQVRALEAIYKESLFTHELTDTDDYIDNPKDSGYRSLHLIYRYRNPLAPQYDKLSLELQIRTKTQHIWATAVETVGTFINHALKSSEGPDEWLEYFQVVGAVFALIERCPIHERFAHLSEKELLQQCVELGASLDVVHRLQQFAIAAQAVTDNRAQGNYHLIVLNATSQNVSIKSFGSARLDEANKAYAEAEVEAAMSLDDIQPVLVATNSVDALRRAYPNYFLDTTQFLKVVNQIEKRFRP